MIALVSGAARHDGPDRPGPTSSPVRLTRVLARCAAAGLALMAVAVLSGGAANASTGAGWAVQRTPDRGQASWLSGVACPSRTTCTAVGGYQTSSLSDRTLAEQWDGRRWKVQPTPNLTSLNASLDSVSCPRAKECFAAGATVGSALHTKILLEQWNGHAWHVQVSGTGGHSGWLTSVSCSSPTACTAVGSAGASPLAERWNGISWKVQRTPNPVRHSWLTGVSCPSGTVCIAVGQTAVDEPSADRTFAERWSRGHWVLQATRNPTGFSFLYAISCSSPNACTSAGYYQSIRSDTDETLAERWNGHTWTRQFTPPPPAGTPPEATFAAVSCPTSSNCLAIGSEETIKGERVLAERWNGAHWTVQPAGNPKEHVPAQLSAASCPSPADCTAVGYYLSIRAGLEQRTLAEHHHL